MKQALPLDVQNGASAPVMVYSHARRDELLAAVARLGWRTSGARRLNGLVNRLFSSGADVLLVDGMGDERATDVVASLASRLARHGVAIAAIYPAGSDAALAHVHAGATHVIAAPYGEVELQAVIISAKRYAARAMATGAISATQSDGLTGLAGGTELRRWIEQNGEQKPVWLLIVNISRFDAVNEAMGAQAADSVLRAVGHRLEPIVAEFGLDCLVSRMAGAEFGLALTGEISPERLMLLAEAIVERVGRPVAADGQTVRLGCHVGIAYAAAGAKDRNTLVRRAAKAVADARSEDTGPVRLVTEGDAKIALQTAALQADLRRALSKGEIEILFQPQFAIASGRIEGVEALARWQHPEHGQIGAKTLFSVAEQSDYLVELSSHVQRRALEMAAAWPAVLSRLRLSVNVTASDVRHPGFAKRFLNRVDTSGFARERLTIEVTETGLMEDLDASAKVLSKFRSAGCRVAIDDFGTGYSSLAYLKALPADYLKLDHGLSSEITGTERDGVVVRGAIDMAHSLGLSVIAEGVESESQLGLLARAGCSHFQGFLRAGPLDVAALTKLVESEA